MSVRPWRVGAAALGILLFLTQSCGLGIDETYTSMGEHAPAGTHLNPICEDCGAINCQGSSGPVQSQDVTQIDPDAQVTIDVDDLTGYAYRFNTLELGAPFDPEGTIGSELNKAVFEQIGSKALNVMMEVSVDDREAGELVFLVGPGIVDGDGYTLDAPTELQCGLAESGFYTKEPGELSLKISLFTTGPTSQDVAPLPLKQVDLVGEFNDDATAIAGGSLQAVLTIEDASNVYFMGMALETWFQDMDDVVADVDTDDDGVPDAYRFTGTFTAAQAEIL